MTISSRQFQSKTCICGRDLDKVHCANCGSNNVYALVSKTNRHTVDVNGVATEIDFGVFRCRRCASLFDEYDLLYHCEAPKFKFRSLQSRRNIDNAAEQLGAAVRTAQTPEQRREALDKLFKHVERTNDLPKV